MRQDVVQSMCFVANLNGGICVCCRLLIDAANGLTGERFGVPVIAVEYLVYLEKKNYLLMRIDVWSYS